MSRARLRAGLSAVGLVAIVSLARADAPGDQYTLFNASSQSITDNFTKLVWERQAPTQPMTFDAAISYCAGLSLDGYAPWRVPSYKELLTLVDESPHLEYQAGALVTVAIDGNAFPPPTPVAPYFYWTSSISPVDTTTAYVVNFTDGVAHTTNFSQSSEYVRCVH
jgi:hypothetical protein